MAIWNASNGPFWFPEGTSDRTGKHSGTLGSVFQAVACWVYPSLDQYPYLATAHFEGRPSNEAR